VSVFPVACYIPTREATHAPVRRRVALGDMNTVMEKAGEDLQHAIIEAVIKQAAFSLSINIALMFVPVIGQAIAGLMSVMSMILGNKYQKDTKDIIARTSEDIQKRAEMSQQAVSEAAEDVLVEEMPAARALAMSQQPLDGLRRAVKKAAGQVANAAKSVAGAVKDAAKDASSALAKVEDSIKEQASKLEDQAKVIATNPEAQMKFITTLSPVGLARLGIKYTSDVIVSTAKLVEKTGVVNEGTLSDPLSKARAHVDENLYTAQKLTSPITGAQEGLRLTAKYGGELTAKTLEAAGQERAADRVRKVSSHAQAYAQEIQKAVTPIGFYNLASGRESYLAAKEACERMRRAAFAEIDRERIEAIAKFRSPEGREAMRVSIAKALRDDPAFIEHMRKLRELEEAELAEYNRLRVREEAALTVLEQNAQPPTTSGAGALVAVATAAAAALLLS